MFGFWGGKAKTYASLDGSLLIFPSIEENENSVWLSLAL